MIKEIELSLLMYILFQGRASPTSTNHWCFNCGDLLYSSCVGERTCGRTRAIQFSVQKRTMVNAKDFLLFSPLPGLVWKYHNRYQNLTIFYHIFLPYFYTISCIRLIFLIFYLWDLVLICKLKFKTHFASPVTYFIGNNFLTSQRQKNWKRGNPVLHENHLLYSLMNYLVSRRTSSFIIIGLKH